MAVIRQFLKEKTRSRIKLHSNLSTLHECIARDVLPTELGGEGPPFNPLEWYHSLLESTQESTNVSAQSRPYYITQVTVYSTPPSNCIKNGNTASKKGSGDPARNSLLSLDDDIWECFHAQTNKNWLNLWKYLLYIVFFVFYNVPAPNLTLRHSKNSSTVYFLSSFLNRPVTKNFY